MNDTGAAIHQARCSCGALSVRVAGEPARINACSCLACQRRSGSAFSYTAFFADAAVVAIDGTATVYRDIREARRWHDSHFCPVCGVAVYCTLETLPGVIGIAVGTLGEPGFAAPERFYWTTSRPHWLVLPAGIGALETQ
jgi:hypothetical protein